MNIKKLRKKAGLSLEDIGSKMKVSSATIRNWETNRTSPSHGEMLLLTKILTKKEAKND